MTKNCGYIFWGDIISTVMPLNYSQFWSPDKEIVSGSNFFVLQK